MAALLAGLLFGYDAGARGTGPRPEALVEERTAALVRTSGIVAHSPVILVRWLPGEDWAVEYVSDNIAQFGYSADGFYSCFLTVTPREPSRRGAAGSLPTEARRAKAGGPRSKDNEGRRLRQRTTA